MDSRFDSSSLIWFWTLSRSLTEPACDSSARSWAMAASSEVTWLFTSATRWVTSWACCHRDSWVPRRLASWPSVPEYDATGIFSCTLAVASDHPDHPSEATASVQLKIPVASYSGTLGQLASRLGTQLSLWQQAQDVTQRVADVNSQVTSDEAAIAQLRALLSHAGSVSDLLSVQNQINEEESNLESMQAQQRALSHETSYATVTLTLLGPKAKPVVHRPKAPPTLAGGLGAGWHALRITVSWTLAFLGAIAPFAAILAIAGYAIYRGRRWLIRHRPTAQSASPES